MRIQGLEQSWLGSPRVSASSSRTILWHSNSFEVQEEFYWLSLSFAPSSSLWGLFRVSFPAFPCPAMPHHATVAWTMCPSFLWHPQLPWEALSLSPRGGFRASLETWRCRQALQQTPPLLQGRTSEVLQRGREDVLGLSGGQVAD